MGQLSSSKPAFADGVRCELGSRCHVVAFEETTQVRLHVRALIVSRAPISSFDAVNDEAKYLALSARSGGGGGDNAENGGAGFGLSAKPAGAYVVRDGKVSWEPAIDVNRIVLGGQIVAVVALLVLRSIFRKRA